MVFFCAQNKLVSNTVQIIFLSLYFLNFLHTFLVFYLPLYAHFPKIFGPILFPLRIMSVIFLLQFIHGNPADCTFFSVALEDENWQKMNPIAFQLVLRDQSGWARLGCISDYDQFGTVSLISLSKDLHNC